MGQLWQGPLGGSGSQQQYLYCNSQPHQPTGLYGTNATCSNKTGQDYASSYDSWGNVTSRTYNGTTATLTYDLLDRFVSLNAGSQSKDLSVYDASGTRVLRRTTTSSGTTMTVYSFGLEEHTPRIGQRGCSESRMRAARPFLPLSHERLDKKKICVYTPNYERTATSTQRRSTG